MSQLNPSQVVDRMFDHDAFSQWLGIERINEGAGHCTLRMTVRDEMTNGFSIAHGGISYSLADSALAFASNAHGRIAVSVETSISHTERVVAGDVLTATAVEKSLTNRLAIYHVEVTKADGRCVALFKGTVYLTEKIWT